MKNKFVRNTIILTVIGLACVLIPSGLITLKSFFYDLPIGIDAYWAQVITLAGVNAIMALSVNVVCSITGQLSLGQAGFQAIGAYAAILLTQNLHLPLPVSIILAGLIAAFFGFLIGCPTLKLEGDYLAAVGVERCKLECVLVGLGTRVDEEELVTAIARYLLYELCELLLKRHLNRV